MKKIAVLLFTALLSASLCACGGNETAAEATAPTASPVEIAAPEKAASPSPSTAPESPEFEPCPDLRIVASYTYNNYTHVVVENTGSQPILNFSLAYINFDKNGFPTTTDSDGYERGKADAVNLMPGDKNDFSWYGASGLYVEAAITSADYADGSSWSISGLGSWASSVRSGFSVDDYKASIAALSDDAALAETNEYALLTEIYITHGNQFSNDHDLNFSVQNTSDLGITRLVLFVLEFDENGFPVSVSPWDINCMNGHTTGGTINLAAGQTGSYSDDLFIQPTTTQIKSVIQHLEFQDGTEWTNPYYLEWILSNNTSY